MHADARRMIRGKRKLKGVKKKPGRRTGTAPGSEYRKISKSHRKKGSKTAASEHLPCWWADKAPPRESPVGKKSAMISLKSEDHQKKKTAFLGKDAKKVGANTQTRRERERKVLMYTAADTANQRGIPETCCLDLIVTEKTVGKERGKRGTRNAGASLRRVDK